MGREEVDIAHSLQLFPPRLNPREIANEKEKERERGGSKECVMCLPSRMP